MSSKAKKKGEKVLLLPGAHGWEAWKGMNGGELNLALRTDAHLALDVGGIPSGELAMAFPVRDVSALPFRAPTGDDALLSDLADMHVERMGMRPLVDAGVLSDFFKVGVRGDETLVVPVVLAPPPEGHLPKRAPQSFDISARCLPLPSEGVVIWRELGRWVFALGEQGQPLHFQALASTALGEDAGREMRLTISQLEMQGLLDATPKHCFVWVADEEGPPTAEELEALGSGFEGTATVAVKPAPVFPPKTCQLLPADIRAERVAKRKKQQLVAGIAAMVVVYIGVVAFCAITLSKAKKGAERATAEFAPLDDAAQVGIDHERKWQELQPLVEPNHDPVELLFLCVNAKPAGEGLRLDRCDIHNQLNISSDGEFRLDRSIQLQGYANEVGETTAFDANLKRERGFGDYRWIAPRAKETKDKKWGFSYDAVLKGLEEG